jgi:hypothetical protein
VPRHVKPSPGTVWIDTPTSSDRDFVSRSLIEPPPAIKLLRGLILSLIIIIYIKI